MDCFFFFIKKQDKFFDSFKPVTFISSYLNSPLIVCLILFYLNSFSSFNLLTTLDKINININF